MKEFISAIIIAITLTCGIVFTDYPEKWFRHGMECHVCIAMTVVTVLTGASLFEAGAVALIEPSINGIWFYILHKTWTHFNA